MAEDKLIGGLNPITQFEPSEITTGRAKQIRQVWGCLIALSILVILILVSTIKINTDESSIQDSLNNSKLATLTNREVGYQSIGVNCQNLFNHGIPAASLPDICKSEEVKKYIDFSTLAPPLPATSADAIKNRGLLCLILKKENAMPPECTNVNVPVDLNP